MHELIVEKGALIFFFFASESALHLEVDVQSTPKKVAFSWKNDCSNINLSFKVLHVVVTDDLNTPMKL